MSGHKQHHIPQSVLKGFATPDKGKIKKVWVFSKDKIFKSSTKDVAAERHFYSQPTTNGDRTLDDLITQYETFFSDRLALLRKAPLGAAADSTTAAEVVAHLTIRNAYLRNTFVVGMRSLLSRAVDLFCHEPNLRTMFGVDAGKFPEYVAATLDEHINSDPRFAALQLPRSIIHKIAFMAMKEHFNHFVIDNLPYIRLALQYLSIGAPGHVARSHQQALSTSFVPDVRIASLSTLHWTVRAAADKSAILPDCIAIGVEGDSPAQPLMLSDIEKLAYVVMPLAPDRLLLGYRLDSGIPDLAMFNRDAASCSHNFFVSSRDGNDLRDLALLIGERSTETIEQAIASAFEGFQKDNQLPAEVPLSTNVPVKDAIGTEEQPQSAAPLDLNYQVTFQGIADQETAERIAATLNIIVRELRPMMSLDRLDGFTFANDYEAALRDIDRGFETHTSLKPTDESYGISIAMTPIVIRDGIVKSRVVARIWIADALIGDNEEAQQLAIHTVIQQLAHVACIQLVDESLPGFFLSRPEDNFDAFLHPCVHSAWSGYFGARASAIFHPPTGDSYRELTLAALRYATETIPAARLAYRYHGDLDHLLVVAFPIIAALLNHCGHLLGHYDGLRRSAFKGQDLESALEQAGLRGWIDLFQMDLSQIWDRRGQWNSIQDFLALNGHAERLFWHFGLFPWKTPEGQLRVEVPLHTDSAQLYRIKPMLRYQWHRSLQWLAKSLKQAWPF